MANKLNPGVHSLQHLSGNNNSHYIDVAQSTLLTIKMDAHDSIRFRAVDKSVSMQHLRFTRHGSDLHVFLDNGHQAAIIEDYFNDPVNIYALDEQDMPHLYLANGTDVNALADLADGESITQTLAPIATSDDSVTEFSAEDSIIVGGEDDDDDHDGFLAGLLSDSALAVAGGIAAAGLAGVAIASASKGKGDSHDDKHQADTTPPAAIHADDIRVTDDAGNRINAGGMTADSTPTISGRVDAAEAGGKVIIRDHGIAIGEATIGKDGSWSMTVSPALKDGVHNLSAVVVDKAGNHSHPSENIDIGVDTIAPNQASEIVLTDDYGKVIDGITNDKTPTVSGKGEAGATVVLKDSDGRELGSTTVNKDGHWTITPGELADGDHELSVEQSDKAGNTSVVQLPALTIDTEIAPVGDITLTDKNGNILEGGATNTGMPDINGKGEAGSTVIVTDEKGTVVGSTTVDEEGNWTIKPEKPLDEGSHDLTVDVTDPAGNHTSAPLPVEIDTAAPGEVTDVVLKDDSGAPIGGVTGDNTPTVSGKGEAGATVVLKDSDGRELGSTTVEEDGSWSITPSEPLADGSHALKVEQKDGAGNVSPAVDLPTVNVDTAAPTQAEDITLTDKAGEPVPGTSTNTTTPAIGGKAEAGSTVTITDNAGNLVGSAQANTDGSWSITPDKPLAEGDQTLTVTVKDAAGNATSSSLEVSVDSVAPDAPDVKLVNDLSGEDVVITDGLTNDNTVVLTGHAEKNSLITIRDGETVLGTATVNDEGTWRFELAEDKKLEDGEHTLIVTATDGYGNVSDETSLPLRVDTINNNVTTLNTLDGTNSTNTDIPRVNGKVDLKDGDSPESVKVLIFDDVDGDGVYDKNVDKLLATVDSIGADGSWNAQLKSMTEGEHHIKAVVVDAAGNYSPVSNLNGSSDGSLDVNAPERTTLWGYDEGNAGGQGRGGIHFASTVKNIGHFSSNDADDIAISAPFSSHGNFNDSGMVYVVYGKSNHLLSQYHDIKQLLDAHPKAGLKIYNSETQNNINGTSVAADRMAMVIEKVDLNGDGINELVISSLWGDKAYVIWGDKIEGIHEIDLAAIDKGDNTYGFSVSSPLDYWFGYSLAAYDYNGDGVQDLMISDIHGPKDEYGGVLVLKGSKDPNHKWENITLEVINNSENTPGGGYTPPASSDTEGDYIYHEKTESGNQNWNLGADMRNVGDINGDGYDDFVILDTRAYVKGASGKGEAYLIYGQKDGFNGSLKLDDLSSDQMVRIQNNGTGWFGEDNPNAVLEGDAGWETEPNQKVIAGLGDFYGDGDRAGDLAIAAPQDQYGSHQGKVWIIKGSSAGIGRDGKLQVGTSSNTHLSTEDGFGIVSSKSSGDRSFGSRIVGGYDIDGDGIPDLIISDPLAVHDGKTVGAVYVVYGGKTGEYQLDANGEISIDSLVSNGLAEVHWGEVPNGRFGSDVDVADMNGDGRLDLIVGANGEDGASNPANPSDPNGNCGSITIIYNHHEVVESKSAAMSAMSLEPDSHAATGAGALILDGDHQNVDLASLTQALKALHHVDLANGENTLTVSSDEVKALSEGQDANAPALTIEGENGNVALTGGQEKWQEGGKVEVNGTVYQAWESSSHSQILVDDRIHVTVL